MAAALSGKRSDRDEADLAYVRALKQAFQKAQAHPCSRRRMLIEVGRSRDAAAGLGTRPIPDASYQPWRPPKEPGVAPLGLELYDSGAGTRANDYGYPDHGYDGGMMRPAWLSSAAAAQTAAGVVRNTPVPVPHSNGALVHVHAPAMLLARAAPAARPDGSFADPVGERAARVQHHHAPSAHRRGVLATEAAAAGRVDAVHKVLTAIVTAKPGQKIFGSDPPPSHAAAAAGLPQQLQNVGRPGAGAGAGSAGYAGARALPSWLAGSDGRTLADRGAGAEAGAGAGVGGLAGRSQAGGRSNAVARHLKWRVNILAERA